MSVLCSQLVTAAPKQLKNLIIVIAALRLCLNPRITIFTVFKTFKWMDFIWRLLAKECPGTTRGQFTHCCDEAVEGLSPLRVLDCDWTEVVSEPDGRDDPARVAVSNIFLCEVEKKNGKKKEGHKFEWVLELRLVREIDLINTETVNPIMFKKINSEQSLI